VHAGENAADLNVATIDFVKGYATIFPLANNLSGVYAKRGMHIKEKDLITTGDNGFISFSFSNGTVVNIQPSSEVSVEKIDCKPYSTQCQLELNAIKGNINSSVESNGDYDTQFTIDTPYASAAVRGTIFDIDVNDGRLLTGVTEGRVDVSTASDAVELPENFGTLVQKNQPPSPPKPLLSPPEFIPGPARYDNGGELTWSSVAMANEYLISLNNTTGLVYSKQLIDTQHRLQRLDVGTYTARIRAIDDDGFRGQISEHEFDVVEIDNSRIGPTLTTTVDTDEYSVKVQAQTASENLIELQFSPTKDFKKLLNLDVALGEVISSNRAINSIYVRGRNIINNTTVTPFGPVVEIPAK